MPPDGRWGEELGVIGETVVHRLDPARAGTVSSRRRCLCAIAVGLVAGAFSMTLSFSDFDQLWMAAHAVRAGRDPYAALHGSIWHDLYYPLPAVLLTIPWTLLPRNVAHACVAGLGLGTATYALSSRGWWALVGLISYPALDAALLAQWSPFLIAAALLPYLEWIAVAKPTTGIATVASYAMARPLRRISLSVAVSASLVCTCFVVQPDWLPRWLAAIRSARHFAPIVVRPGGALLLAALLRWRLPEARLVVLLALLPQTIAPYEALLLTLALASRREALVFSFASFAMHPFLSSGDPAVSFVMRIDHDAPIIILFLYLPVLIMILRRPNAGRVPSWIEQIAGSLPPWLRGTDLAS